MSFTAAERMVADGRVTVQEGKFYLYGHSLEEMSSTNYVMFKPIGVTTRTNENGVAYNSLLPFPFIPFGYVSPLERSSSGLLLLLNDIDVGRRITGLRTYNVSLDPTKPLTQTKLYSLGKSIPFVPFEIIPHRCVDVPIGCPFDSVCSLTIRTFDCRPHLIRTIFNSIGVHPVEVRLESIGKLSLFSLTIPGDVRTLDISEIKSLIDYPTS